LEVKDVNITKGADGKNISFYLDGRLDSASSHRLQKQLSHAFNENPMIAKVALDFGKLTYVSSAGLRVLLTAQKIAAAKKMVLEIRNVSAEVMNIFSMTGFSNIFTVV
jgi:anti-sigma B factor antagonist